MVTPRPLYAVFSCISLVFSSSSPALALVAKVSMPIARTGAGSIPGAAGAGVAGPSNYDRPGAPSLSGTLRGVLPSAGGAAVGADNRDFEVPAVEGAPIQAAPNFGELTGALTRTTPDPGPIKKMWFVFEKRADIEAAADSIRLIQTDNPGLEIEFVDLKDVPLETPAEAAKRVAEAGVEFILLPNVHVYENFKLLRDKDLARETAMGFLGRHFVSVDMPRASLDPAALSDPRRYPHKRYMIARRDGPVRRAAPIADMSGIETVIEEVLAAPERAGETKPLFARLKSAVKKAGLQFYVRASGQGDGKATRRLRRKAINMAANLEKEGVDVLVIDDAEASEIAGMMKRMGRFTDLPVVWAGRGAPTDASGLNTILRDGAGLEDAIARAPKLERLPGNFMEMGGVSVKDFEPMTRAAVRAALPAAAGRKGLYDVHFLLTHGNGVDAKGDRNAFGHFGMAVEDENGELQVWTVQYEDGGTFTGGLGAGKQTTLGEYVYANWYLPGATGQPIPLGQNGEGPVLDFIVRSVDAAGVEAMRHMAAAINARFLLGQDNYSFTNKGMLTNCISMVTQILRAAGFRIAESGVQAPADKAVEMISLLTRSLMRGEVGADRIGFLVFDKPAHASSYEYRINNFALGSPMVTRDKPWKKMSLWEKFKRVLFFPRSFIEALWVPRTVEAFSKMASHRLVAGPNSRTLELVENPDSPILNMRESERLVAELRAARVGVLKGLEGLENEILEEIGFEGWRRNPEKEKKLDDETLARLLTLRARHTELEVELALNNFDEQIAERKVRVHKIRLADPLGRFTKGLKPVEKAYLEVLKYRAIIARERRILNLEELEALQAYNVKAEKLLRRLEAKILKDAGDPAPADMRMIFRQVSMDALAEGSQDGSGKSGKKAAGGPAGLNGAAE